VGSQRNAGAVTKMDGAVADEQRREEQAVGVCRADGATDGGECSQRRGKFPPGGLRQQIIVEAHHHVEADHRSQCDADICGADRVETQCLQVDRLKRTRSAVGVDHGSTGQGYAIGPTQQIEGLVKVGRAVIGGDEWHDPTLAQASWNPGSPKQRRRGADGGLEDLVVVEVSMPT
jgi:hypothetical protein